MFGKRFRTLTGLTAVAVSVMGALAVLPQLTRSLVGERAGQTDAIPAGQILVVQANLQDAIRPADAADTADLDNFARRLLASSPAAPDALLVTEILGPGARHLAQVLSSATGQAYQAVVAAGDSAFLADGSVRESAVIVNTSTMQLGGMGGFVRMQNEDEAFQLVTPRQSQVQMPLVAGHVSGDPADAVTAIDAMLNTRFPAPGGDRPLTAPVIAADFRYARCVTPGQVQAIDCVPNTFWTALTSQLRYTDAGFENSAEGDRRATNYVFAGGRVHDAYLDIAYDTDLADRAACKSAFDAGRSASTAEPCRSTYYADQPFTWALVGAREPVQRSVVPERVVLGRCELSTRLGTVLVRTVNNTAATDTVSVTASAAAPLTISPASSTLTVPAGAAGSLAVRVSAARATSAGDYPVRIQMAGLVTTVPVTVPAGDCVEAPAYASSYNPGFPPEQAVDGDINTFWHSEWSPPHPLPQSLTVNLGQVRSVHNLHYQPRFDGNLNGTITGYKVYVSMNGTTFTQVTSGTWSADARQKTATFTAVAARYVRLEAVASVGGSLASAAEISAD